jgi:hypothetical protein
MESITCSYLATSQNLAKLLVNNLKVLTVLTVLALHIVNRI